MRSLTIRIQLLVSIAYAFGLSGIWAQTPAGLTPQAQARIEQARTSVVIINVEDAQKHAASAAGVFVRDDLIATSIVARTGSQVRVTGTDKQSVNVVSSGEYLLPYVLVVPKPNMAPVRLGDSDKVQANDRIFMFADSDGSISAGTVAGTRMVKHDRVFLISIPVNSLNRGGPVFNSQGEVIGIAAENPDGEGHGIAFPSSTLKSMSYFGQPGFGAGRGEPTFGTGGGMGPGVDPPDKKRSESASTVDSRPILLTNVRPGYTEIARNNKIQGVVLLRVLVGEDGLVKRATIIRGLPDGLSELAIAAAYKSKFKPAMKDGKPVAYSVALQIEFNLR
jgi:TonB family protein